MKKSYNKIQCTVRLKRAIQRHAILLNGTKFLKVWFTLTGIVRNKIGDFTVDFTVNF